MDDLPKMELHSPEITLVDKKKRFSTMKPNKKLVFIILIPFVLIIALVAIAIVPAKKTYFSAQKTYKQARVAWDAIKKQNIDLGEEELKKTKVSLEDTKKELEGLSFLRFIPIASWYYNDANHLLKVGLHSIDASFIVVDAIKPYSDILGLKGKGGSFVMGSAEQRIQTAILTMGKITPRIDDVAENIALAKTEIDAVDSNHYPAFLGLGKLNTQLAQAKEFIDGTTVFVNQAQPLIKVLPSLLGESEQKKYLILFQNANELRPTGGFLTAYAIFSIDKGKITVEKSDDIYNLDNTIPNSKKPKAPAPILNYLVGVPLLNLRDANLSPDFLESIKTFKSLYEFSSVKEKIDGIIALDSNVLTSVIKILDDEVWAGGMEFTTKNDPRCNCPQAIYKLESLISTPKSLDLRVTSLAAAQAQRKDILGTLLYSIMQKALKSSPKKYWGPLVQDLITQANEKHVLFALNNKDAQRGVEALNMAGQIKNAEGDYFHFNDTNLGGAKSNLFVKETVDQDIKVDGDGTITKTVTVLYKNPFPPSDCNLERGNLCLNGILRDWFRLYVPKGSVLIDSKGSEVKVTTIEDLNKTVFEGFLTVRPQGSAILTLTYSLPFKLKAGSPLPLLIQKQPGTDKNEYTVKINGRTVNTFPLLTDRELVIKR
ncbi:MAG: DUF4012 domain-containing protein [Candidatus Levyibacteriota bacterium]|nr:MAG: DUF4012 domain-containing protein [Candidatus Levybacteria bacterium]